MNRGRIASFAALRRVAVFARKGRQVSDVLRTEQTAARTHRLGRVLYRPQICAQGPDICSLHPFGASRPARSKRRGPQRSSLHVLATRHVEISISDALTLPRSRLRNGLFALTPPARRSQSGHPSVRRLSYIPRSPSQTTAKLRGGATALRPRHLRTWCQRPLLQLTIFISRRSPGPPPRL